jgi:hypothetical protein
MEKIQSKGENSMKLEETTNKKKSVFSIHWREEEKSFPRTGDNKEHGETIYFGTEKQSSHSSVPMRCFALLHCTSTLD